MPAQNMINGQLFKPEVPPGSCLGGEASYLLMRGQPTLNDLQRLIPDYAPGDFLLTYPMDTPTHTYNQMNNIGQAVVPDIAYNQMMPMDALPDISQFESNGFDDMAFVNQPFNFTFGDADVTTFGSQPLQSPQLLQSPLQQQFSEPPGRPQSHVMPTSQTVNPGMLQAQTPYPAPAHLTHHPSTPLTEHDLFFDDTLATVPVDPQFGIPIMSPGLHENTQFNYPHPHRTNPLSSRGP